MMETRTVVVAVALVLAVIAATVAGSVHHTPINHAQAAAAPQPTTTPACAASVQPGAYTTAVWEGVNAGTHSVSYARPGVQATTVTAPWCTAPTVLAADGAPSSLAAIPRGATVRVVTSSAGWVTEVIIEHSGRLTRS